MGRRIKGKSRETIFIKLISSKDRRFCVNVSVRGDKRVMGIEVYGKFMTLTQNVSLCLANGCEHVVLVC